MDLHPQDEKLPGSTLFAARPSLHLRRVTDRLRPMAQPHLDGVLKLDELAAELTHETFESETKDREDHTFSGIMFDVACQSLPRGPSSTSPVVRCLPPPLILQRRVVLFRQRGV